MDSNETVSLAPSESESLSKNIVHVNGYDNAGGVSDDEGYPSGQEEFETASEDSATVETVGEDNFDEQFVDAPSDVGIFSDSEAVDVSEDDDVEIFSNNDVEGIEYALEKGEAVVADKLELGLDEIGDVDSGKLVVDEVEMNGGDESELEGEPVVDVSSSRAAVVEKIDEDGDKGATSVAEPGRVVVDEAEINGGDELEFKGDSVDELSSSGAAVVEKIDEKGDINSRKDAKEVVEPEKLVVNETEMNGVDEPESEGESVVDVCGSGAAVVGKTDENKDINDGKVAKEVVEPGKSVVDEAEMNGGDEPESDGDYVVDVSGSGAAVVEKIDENRDINNRKDAKEVVEPGKSVVGEAEMNGGDEPESEGDSGAVVSGSGAAVVEKIDQNGDFSNGKDAKEVVEPEKLVVDEAGMNGVDEPESGESVVDVSGSGATVVDKIDENRDINNGKDAKEVVEPVKLVVNEAEMNGGDEPESEGDSGAVVSGSGAAVVEKIDQNGDFSNGKDAKEVVEPEKSEVINRGVDSEEDCAVDDGNGDGKIERNGDVANESDAKEVIEAGENATEDNKTTTKSVTNGEIGVDRDENQLHPSNGVFEDELVSEELDHADFNETKVENDVDKDFEFIEEFAQTTGMDSSEQEEEEEGDTADVEGEDEELFDSAALSALLKATSGAADSDGSGNITITSRDGTRLFTVERPVGPGSSFRALRPAAQLNPFSPSPPNNVGVSEDSLSEEEKKNLEKLQQIRVKFLRLVHRLGLSPDEPVAAQVLYRLGILSGRKGTGIFSLDAAKNMSLQLESEERENLDFSVNILMLGKSGVGKSATINSIFGEEKAHIDPYEKGTFFTKEISGFVDGVKICVLDTPGLNSSLMEQSYNNSILSSVKKLTKKTPPDVFLYVDRLDSQTRDLNDLPILKSVTASLGRSIWQNAIVTLTHAACDPPDGLNGTPLSYEMFVAQRSHSMHQSIGHAVGPGLMNPVSLVENRKNGRDEKILPNGQIWRPQLLLLCYSMKILSEAGSIIKANGKQLGFRARSPPLPYMLSSILQTRPHPKIDDVDSDIDSDELSELDEEKEDEYDSLPPFRPLKKSQIEKLTKEQKNAYFEEFDYRVKLLQKKQWREELSRMIEIKNNGQDFADVDAGDDGAAPVAVPLPDMSLPPSFDGDSPAFRYRFLEPGSRFLARPVLDTHGWDHDCGYDGVNLEHALAVDNRFPVSYTVQITKDKKDFNFSLDSSIAAKHGEDTSNMVGFDIQSMGKQMAYTVRGETKVKKFKRNKVGGGVFLTFLGGNVVPGLKVEDRVTLGKQYVLVGSGGVVGSGNEMAYGADIEVQRREIDYPIGEVESTLGVSIVKWRGDWALGINSLAQFSLGRNSKVAVRAGINNKLSGQISVKTSSSENFLLALAAVVPAVITAYRKVWPGADETYSVY